MILVEFFIEQAVLKLASPHTFAINNDQEEIRLIGKNLILCNIKKNVSTSLVHLTPVSTQNAICSVFCFS